MTAGQQANAGTSAAAGAAKLYNITTGAGGLFVNGSQGTLSPLTYGGKNINVVGSYNGYADFAITLLPPVSPIDFFTKIVVLDSVGVWRTYNSNEAQYQPDATSWFWGSGGGNLVWPGIGTYQFRIYPGK